LLDGRPAGKPGSRTAIWQAVDPSRTGFRGDQIGTSLGDAPMSYAAFALAAEGIPQPRESENGQVPCRVPFGEWLERGGSRPDPADLAHHLSTLFPPVRPRGHLEVRYLDAVPARWRPVPIALLATLLYEPGARREALELLEGAVLYDEAWATSASSAMRDPALRASALALFEIGLARFSRMPAGYLPDGVERLAAGYRERFPESSRCPADEQLDRFIRNPEDMSTWR
jgi:glutamate--cysteine ligase